MTIVQAIFLGVVQGLTEFLPVSSSAHLIILQNLWGLEGPILLVFDVVVHVGTLAAILVYFAKELFPVSKIGARMFGLILVATLPTAAIGLIVRRWIDPFFTTLGSLSVTLLITSLILWSTRWVSGERAKEMHRWRDAFWIGIVQGISVLPGISRLGSTVSAALWLGLKREEAVRFSFFIAVPAIFGTAAVILPKAIALWSNDTWPVLASGCAAAFISGYLAINVLFKIVCRGRFHYFAFYTLALAALAFFFSMFTS